MENTTGKVEKMSSKPITKGPSNKTSSICKNVVSDKISDHDLEMARKLDKLLQNEVKKILHLPSWTGTE